MWSAWTTAYVVLYGLNNRNFPGLDQQFLEGKIKLIRGKNPVCSYITEFYHFEMDSIQLVFRRLYFNVSFGIWKFFFLFRQQSGMLKSSDIFAETPGPYIECYVAYIEC